MDLLHLVDRLEEMIGGAQKMPIGNRAIVDRRRMLDLIDQMRVAIPEEVRAAQEIVAHRDAIRRDAEEEGRIIVARAEERAARLVEQHEITQTARRRAEEIAREAEQRLELRLDEVNRDIKQRIDDSRDVARHQMQAADDYSRELLERLERQLQAFVNSVHSGIRQLEPAPEPPEAQYERVTLPPDPEPVFAPAYDDDDEESYPDDAHAAELTARAGESSWSPGVPAYAAPEEDEERVPVPIRSSAAAEQAAERDDDLDELENLLRRPAAEDRAAAVGDPPPADPGVIDDYELEPLDDDPLWHAAGDDESR